MAIRITAIYIAAGATWVAASDWLLGALVSDPAWLALAQTWKGWLFVALSGALIYLLSSRAMRSRDRLIDQLRIHRSALQASEQRYHGLFKDSHAVMLVIDPADGCILDANRAAADFYGYPRETLCSMHIHQLNVAPQAEIEAAMQRARAAGERHFRFEHRLASGELRAVDVYSGPVPIDGVPKLFSIVHDVTEQRQAQHALQETEARFRALVEQSLVGAYIIKDGRLNYANPRMHQIFGYPPGMMNGMSVYELGVEEDLPLMREQIRARLAGEIETAHYQFRGRHREGDELWLEVHGSAATLDGGPAIIGVCLDITADMAAAAREAAHLQRAEEAMRGTVRVLTRLVEIRDPYTAGHERRVAELATAIGRELGLPEDRLEGLAIAASVHDLGKIVIPSDILARPGPLSEVEYEMVQEHAAAGQQLLSGIEFPWPLATIVGQHHERLDGSGYPAGLQGDAILLEARILAVADVVEAMTSHRPHRPALPLEVALATIDDPARFDARAAAACARLCREQGFRFSG